MLETHRSMSRLTKVLIGISATLSLLGGVVSSAATVQWIRLRDVGTDPIFRAVNPEGDPNVKRGPCTKQACNFLVLGSDSRKGLSADFGTDESLGGTSRADTIMLVHTDPRSQKAIVLSFPRDLWVRIPGEGFDRINSAFEGGPRGGGPQLMARTVADLTGLPVNHYVYLDLESFRDVVNRIGGVDMCIPAYHVNTPGWVTKNVEGEATQVYVAQPGRIVDPNAKLNIAPGCQRLDGQDALAYVRARHLPCDRIPDFARIGRQQQFLRALINQMLQPSMVVRAPGLVPEVVKHLQRDRGLLPSDLVYLVGQLRGVATGAVEFRAVPGTGAMIDSKSVLRLDESAERLFAALRSGRSPGNVGSVLQSTPPSEANTTVGVMDEGGGDGVATVQDVLRDAGFDITPGLIDGVGGPAIGKPTIVFSAGSEAQARVVAAYFPDLPVVGPRDLGGAQVAIVVTPGYRPAPPAQSGQQPGASCPEAA
jgi:LCP family protein required for cell wall assembly